MIVDDGVELSTCDVDGTSELTGLERTSLNEVVIGTAIEEDTEELGSSGHVIWCKGASPLSNSNC